MENNAYDFAVKLEPISVLGHEVVGKKAVVRTDTEKTLGIVSDNYKILTHASALEGIQQAIGNQDHKANIVTVREGAHMYATFTMRNVTGEVRKGDMVGLQFTAKNSYDGSTALQISLGALRLVCTNGMVLSDKFFNFSLRHTGEAKIEVSRLAEKLEQLTSQFQHQIAMMKMMAETDAGIGTDTFRGEAFSEERVALPEYLLETAYNEFVRAKDGSKWGYYNALTYAITHQMRRQSPQTALNYGRIAWRAAAA